MGPRQSQLVAARLRKDGQTLRTVPLSGNRAGARIDYPGTAEVFPTVSLADVLEGRVPDEALRGKAALVGVTLVGQYDQVVTPFRNVRPASTPTPRCSPASSPAASSSAGRARCLPS